MAQIDELGGQDHGWYYTEGHSDKLHLFGETGTWFCFEDQWVGIAMELQRVGFTATQILEARDDTEAARAEADDRPWGEQQGQVDWLESRFDEQGPADLYDEQAEREYGWEQDQ